MIEHKDFPDFVRRIRGGDAQAAETLVKQYEPLIRLEVRMRLRDPRLRRLWDSMDVCQSVLGSFFARAASGNFDLNQPDQLTRLLVGIARNKVAYKARRHKLERTRTIEPGSEALDPADNAGTPSEKVVWDELRCRFRERLSPEERRLADLRAQGLGWTEIAERLGGTAGSRRKQLERAVRLVSDHLNLGE